MVRGLYIEIRAGGLDRDCGVVTYFEQGVRGQVRGGSLRSRLAVHGFWGYLGCLPGGQIIVFPLFNQGFKAFRLEVVLWFVRGLPRNCCEVVCGCGGGDAGGSGVGSVEVCAAEAVVRGSSTLCMADGLARGASRVWARGGFCAYVASVDPRVVLGGTGVLWFVSYPSVFFDSPCVYRGVLPVYGVLSLGFVPFRFRRLEARAADVGDGVLPTIQEVEYGQCPFVVVLCGGSVLLEGVV